MSTMSILKEQALRLARLGRGFRAARRATDTTTAQKNVAELDRRAAGQEARIVHVARTFLRGRPYGDVEPTHAGPVTDPLASWGKRGRCPSSTEATLWCLRTRLAAHVAVCIAAAICADDPTAAQGQRARIETEVLAWMAVAQSATARLRATEARSAWRASRAERRARAAARLYVLVRGDLAPGAQIAQASHGLARYALEHPTGLAAWRHAGEVLVVLAARDAAHLATLRVFADIEGGVSSAFHEPDRGGELTCVVAHGRAGPGLSGLPLALARGAGVPEKACQAA